MTTTIYVALLNEGTSCWRPVRAEVLDGGLYRILGSVPEEESWEFEPGATVRCREKIFNGGSKGLVAHERG